MPRLRMGGAIIFSPLYALTAWAGTFLLLSLKKYGTLAKPQQYNNVQLHTCRVPFHALLILNTLDNTTVLTLSGS
jgi:hypothetical protein